MRAKAPNLFSGKLFDVEHAINIYAYSYMTLPPHEIYNKKALAKHSELISNCHIYIVGLIPRLELKDIGESEGNIEFRLEVGGEPKSVSLPLPEGATLRGDGETNWVELANGQKVAPRNEALAFLLNRQEPIPFDVLYIGQAYGEDGNRNAIDRLTKHETLQKIALTENDKNSQIQVLILEIQPQNRMHVLFNPWADEIDDDGTRVTNALDSLFETTEAQQVSLYEAAMIRYFQPKYNKMFKDSFPSTNLKVLAQCYEKDMAAVIAEFCFDELPFFLRSEATDIQPYHIAGYNIHEKKERDVFFGMQTGELVNLAE